MVIIKIINKIIKVEIVKNRAMTVDSRQLALVEIEEDKFVFKFRTEKKKNT